MKDRTCESYITDDGFCKLANKQCREVEQFDCNHLRLLRTRLILLKIFEKKIEGTNLTSEELEDIKKEITDKIYNIGVKSENIN